MELFNIGDKVVITNKNQAHNGWSFMAKVMGLKNYRIEFIPSNGEIFTIVACNLLESGNLLYGISDGKNDCIMFEKGIEKYEYKAPEFPFFGTSTSGYKGFYFVNSAGVARLLTNEGVNRFMSFDKETILELVEKGDITVSSEPILPECLYFKNIIRGDVNKIAKEHLTPNVLLNLLRGVSNTQISKHDYIRALEAKEHDIRDTLQSIHENYLDSRTQLIMDLAEVKSLIKEQGE